MNPLPVAIFSAILVVVSVLLVVFDWRTYQRRLAAAEKDQDRKAAWLRFRRRVQASSGIGVVGILALAGALIDAKAYPLIVSGIWLLVILVTFWVGLMAFLDLMASRRQLIDLRHEQMIQTAILRAQIDEAQKEVRKHRELEANGKHRGKKGARDKG